jgi:hypothetical protein
VWLLNSSSLICRPASSISSIVIIRKFIMLSIAGVIIIIMATDGVMSRLILHNISNLFRYSCKLSHDVSQSVIGHGLGGLHLHECGTCFNLCGFKLSQTLICCAEIIVESFHLQPHFPLEMLYNAACTWRMHRPLLLSSEEPVMVKQDNKEERK